MLAEAMHPGRHGGKGNVHELSHFARLHALNGHKIRRFAQLFWSRMHNAPQVGVECMSQRLLLGGGSLAKCVGRGALVVI